MTGQSVLVAFIETETQQWLATGGVLLAVLAAVWAIRYVGRWLREHYDPRGSLLEAAQAGLIVALSAGAATAFLLIWQDEAAVRALRTNITPTTEMLVSALVTLFLFVGAWGTTVFAKRLITGIFEERDAITRHQREVAYHVIQISVYLVAIAAGVTVWGIDIGNILLGAGFLGVVVGLAARQTLASVFAGFVLLFGRPFNVGDWIVVDEHEGIVTDVSIFTTVLRTFNGEFVTIPNDVVTSGSLLNRSRRGRLRVDVEVGVDYDDDIERARELATEAMRDLDTEEIRTHPEPETVLKEFGDSAVVLELRFWVDDPTAARRWQAQTDVIRAVKDAFAEAGITIPFPQRSLASRPGSDITVEGNAVEATTSNRSDDA